MTKYNFQTLCEQVLVPLIGNLLHHQMAGLHESLDIIARELVRIGDRLEETAASVAELNSNAIDR